MINAIILFGGKSVEHDISVITYTQVISAIDLKKYNVRSVYLDQDNNFYLLKNDYLKIKCLNDLLKVNNLKRCCFKRKYHKNKYQGYCNNFLVDIVINCVHGKGLEDGTISSYFDLLDIKYTNSNLSSSLIFHNKFYTKLILNKYNIKTLSYDYISLYNWQNKQQEELKKLKNYQSLVIKPVNLGSSIAIKSFNEGYQKEDVINAIDNCFLYDDGILIEKKLAKFYEYNQAGYKIHNEFVISKIEEVKNDSSIYDFNDKYQNDNITKVINVKIDNKIKVLINKTTRKIMEIFNQKGVIRVDYLYDVINNTLFVNEINVIPGALAFYLFEAKNIYFPKLIDDLVKEALNSQFRPITLYNSTILQSNKYNKYK